jgi:hypothetical protein
LVFIDSLILFAFFVMYTPHTTSIADYLFHKANDQAHIQSDAGAIGRRARRRIRRAGVRHEQTRKDVLRRDWCVQSGFGGRIGALPNHDDSSIFFAMGMPSFVPQCQELSGSSVCFHFVQRKDRWNNMCYLYRTVL